MTEKELIELIRVAQRPCENMRIHFTKEIFDRSLTSHVPPETDEKLILPTVEYTLTLLDEKARYKAMYLETLKSGVCKKYESERDIRKTFCGLIIFVRPVIFDLFGYFDFNDQGYEYNRRFGVSQDVRDGFYVLESFERDGGKIRFTVDGNKGFNVVRGQHLFDDGKVNFESIHDVKQFSNGTWFQTGYDMIRYGDLESGRQARYHRCVRVTDVEFDIEINEKTFELPEGVDAITSASP